MSDATYTHWGTFRKTPDAGLVIGLDCTSLLASGEQLSGTVTVTDGSGELTISSKQVVSDAFSEKDGSDSFASGKGISMLIEGGRRNATYFLTFSVANDNGVETVAGDFTIEVVARRQSSN